MTTSISANAGHDLDAVAVPPGTEAGDWQQDKGREYRLVYSHTRSVPGRDDVYVQAVAVQLDDGSIDRGAVEGPGMHVGVANEPLTVEQARRLAVEIMTAADHLAALSGPDPVHPLDAYSLPAIVDHITRRITGARALRTALATTDPAELTTDDVVAMTELLAAAPKAASIE